MQSTTPPSIIALRMSPSPDWLEDMETVGQHHARRAVGAEMMEDML